MKLKTVSVSFDFVIVVDDDDSYAQQQSHAEYYMREALGDAGHQCSDITIWDYPDVPCEGWDGDCIPYGGDGNTRTSEYLTKSS